MRKSLHKVLSWPIYGYHDAYMMAGEIGDETTIPLLVEIMKQHEQDSAGDGVTDCAWGHLSESLQKLREKYPQAAALKDK